MQNLLSPLPSLIRATAQEACDSQMKRFSRRHPNEDDKALILDTQDRLIRALFANASDGPGSKLCYLRFAMAERFERAGMIDPTHAPDDVIAMCDHALAGEDSL